MADGLAAGELVKLVSIPLVAAVVGWGTNWLAIKLTFYPLEFVGLRPIFGWQGIVPSKAERMAVIFVRSTMARLGTLSEVFAQIEPQRLADHVARRIDPRLDELTDEVMRRGNARLWAAVPGPVKAGVYARVRRRMPRRIDRLMAEIGERIEELIDLEDMIGRRLVADKALLNRLFLECGEREFRFIVRSGAGFGFLFGLVQLAVWVAYPAWWVLPAFGAAVGWATNWIALNLIFRPLEPVKLGPFTLQGLFLKRQPEVAAVWCGIVTREILTVRQLVAALLTGPRAERTRELIGEHIAPVVEEATARPLAQLAVGLDGYDGLKRAVGDKAVEVSAAPFDDPAFNEERGQVIERLLRERIEALPPAEFQDLLRPCFQEDETKLILLGAALGLVAGAVQLVLVFGGS